MNRIAFAAAAAFLATPALAQNNVSIDQDLVYYDVKGMTAEEIARSLRRDAPRALDGFQGEATFYFSWRYDYGEADTPGDTPVCRVSRARVDIEIEVTLPRHRTIARAPDALEETWRGYVDALERHERNHAKDFAEIGAMIPEALNGLVGPCSSIEGIANAKGTEYVDRAQRAADDYDAQTNHGETEGTFFPGI